MERINKIVSVFLVGIVCLAFLNGCGHRSQTLTIRAYIDGSDVIKISGNTLWFEHEKFSLPAGVITVDGKAWTPNWNQNVSTKYNGINPAFNPTDPQRIQISKKTGRGTVSIVEMPTLSNNETLTIRVDDNDFNGADWYDILISW